MIPLLLRSWPCFFSNRANNLQPLKKTVGTWTPHVNNSMPPRANLILLPFPFFQTWHLDTGQNNNRLLFFISEIESVLQLKRKNRPAVHDIPEYHIIVTVCTRKCVCLACARRSSTQLWWTFVRVQMLVSNPDQLGYVWWKCTGGRCSVSSVCPWSTMVIHTNSETGQSSRLGRRQHLS